MEIKVHPARLAPEAPAAGVPWTLIGPGSSVRGELLMTGNVLIHGRVEGVVFTRGEVQVASGAWVEGGIHARRIYVDGAVEGRLEAVEEAVLRRGSVVRGDIEAQVLTVEDGARFLGTWIRSEHRNEPRIHPAENPTGNA